MRSFTTSHISRANELGRLGLTEQTETLVRSANPDQTGMLTVEQVIPQSAADGKLAPGDILVRVNGELITEFVPLAAILDDSVGKEITIELERGGRSLSETILVVDLHDISPDEYLEFGDAIIHNLSYQQARHYNRRASGVYVANPGYALSRSAIPRGAVIDEVGGKPVENISDIEKILDGLGDRDKTTLRYKTIDDPRNSIVARRHPGTRQWRTHH